VNSCPPAAVRLAVGIFFLFYTYRELMYSAVQAGCGSSVFYFFILFNYYYFFLIGTEA
jgi:hypothetical protein